MNDMRSQLSRAGYNTNLRPVRNNNFNNTPIFKAPLNYDVVDDAEKVIKSLQYIDSKTNQPKIDLTTSQIRKFLTAVNIAKNKVDLFLAQNRSANVLPDELVADIKFLKINIMYQAGKDQDKKKPIKRFMETANLTAIIDDIHNDIKKFQKFCKYVEALVAYRKFLGGDK